MGEETTITLSDPERVVVTDALRSLYRDSIRTGGDESRRVLMIRVLVKMNGHTRAVS